MAQPIYLDPELQGIEREKQLALALQQRGLKPTEGQIIGNRYVAPSWSQNLANLYDVYSGGQRMAEAEKKQQVYADLLRQRNAADIQEALSLAKGTPEQTTYGAGEEGPTKTVQVAVPGNKEAAIARLLKSESPMAGTIASKLIEQQFKEPKWEKAELTDPKTGNTKQGWVDLNAPNPEATFRQGGEKPALSPKDVMQGRFEGWYNPNIAGGVAPSAPSLTSAGQPLGMPSARPVSQPLGQPNAPISMPGLSPQAAIQANKELLVDKAKRKQEYAEQAPANIEMMNQTIGNINDLIGDAKVVNGKIVQGTKAPHPGFEQSVGFGTAPLAKYIPGSDVSDFRQRFDQIKGQAFLQAFNNLKGGGQITEIEGAKATNALNRMSLAQSEKEFITAAREFEENVNKGMQLARERAGIPAPQGTWRVK